MARWDYKDIDYESINCENISGNEVLFQLIVIASFIEITSDLYEKNLVEFSMERLLKNMFKLYGLRLIGKILIKNFVMNMVHFVL